MHNFTNIKRLAITFAVFAIVTCGSSLTAKADLVQLNPNVDLQGQGIGAVLTVLTLQTTGTAETESAYVGFADGGFHAFGDFSPPDGSPKNQPFTYADLGATNASEIVLIVNLAEPNSEVPATVRASNAGSINVSANRITLNVWDTNGNLLQTHTLAVDTVLVMDQSGVGGSGLIFALDATQAAAVNALGPNIIFTVGATFQSAQGGNDTIQAARLVAVPEPASMLLLGTGLLGVAGAVRRRLRK